MELVENKLDKITRKLDIISIILLAKSGIPQKQIAKILGISNKTIVEMFGSNYEKIQDDKNE